MHSTARAATPSPTRQVAWFFVATFVITWGVQAPAVLAKRGVLDAPWQQFLPLVALGAFGPTFGALIAAGITEGRSGVRALFARFSLRGVSLPLIVLAPFVSGLLYVGGRAVYGLFADDGGGFWRWPDGMERWAALVIFSIGEEIGWRGYAQPRLVERYGSLTASVVIGVFWALWHLPMNALESMPLVVNLAFIPFLVFGSIVFTWWTTLARGSIAVAFLLHTGAHLNNPHHVFDSMLLTISIHTAAYGVAAIAIVALAKKGWRTRAEARAYGMR